MATTKEIVMYDSPEAAELKTVTGWVSRDGLFFGADERTARYSGCTHRSCEGCGEPVEKHYVLCSNCRRNKADERFAALPRVEWDGITPLCLWDGDTFFWSEDDLNDWCEDHDTKAEHLQLVVCVPVYGRRIESDYFCDELPEDGDVPDVIKTAMETLNQAIEAAGALSWRAGKYAAIIKSREG